MDVSQENIGFFDSSYALLLFFIKYTDKIENTFFFISDGIPENVRKNINFFHIAPFDFSGRDKSTIKKIKKKINYEVYLYKESKIPYVFSEKVKIYGQDHIVWSTYFLNRYKNIIIFEDGFSSYTHPKKKFFKLNLLRKLFKQEQFSPYGVNSKVSKIYLTGLMPIPEIIKDKVEIIDLQKLWDSKKPTEKELILSIFNLSVLKMESMACKKVILLTQTLSEDQLMSETEKIELYREMLEPYKVEDVLIKPHPREKTDYKKFFPKYEVVNEQFPVQLFKLNHIRFEEVVTVFSTAANDFLDGETKLVFKGTKFDERFSEKYGKITYNEMKREIEYE